MAAESIAPEFDPLVELYGMWTTELAEHYLPIPFASLVGKYECLDGYLIMSPREGSRNSFAASALNRLLFDPALEAGHLAYLTLNVEFEPRTWIEPDLVVLKEPVNGLTWVPADKVLIPVEFVSTSSRRRDRIDKPKLCAEAGIPYFMRVEIDNREVHVELFQLDDGQYRLHAKALTGQRFETEVPFPISFDPVVLLEP
ncbi:Uma2 family endonuclease [Kibdelosporangium philippinense]|uniref:Uma2 family endonuclease n=2 Tax=Kibdelosporangium philippinense TaxID=211113 RepID=A0ABS8ZBA2_9PSEU|nr:Uma2 family endonuclease [Kibdelosporangium philippinense]MCE7005153.1 Uma2 family endonuclease [Kibdelosporangium philippinense]